MSKMSKGKTWFDRYDKATFNREFDGMEKYKGSGDVWARNFIAKRLAKNAGIDFDPDAKDKYCPTLHTEWLKWNKNPQCLPKTWDGLLSKEGKVTYKECKADIHKRICVKWYNTATYTFVFCFCEDLKLKDWEPGEDPSRRAWKSTSNQKSLILPRHNPYEKSLEIVNYVGSYCPPRLSDAIIAYEGNTKQEPHRNYGFWLIDEKDADFVYAILKSSMFRAWCKLTANSGGYSHFAPAMWDTFPLTNLTDDKESEIKTAGWELQEGRKDSQKKLDQLIDGLFTPADSTHILSDECRIRILAQGFLDAFYGV